MKFKLLTGRIYYFKFKLALYFYEDIQPLFQEKFKARTSQIEFVSLDKVDCLRNTEMFVLVFDNPCEKIYKDKSSLN